mgnify:FL=1
MNAQVGILAAAGAGLLSFLSPCVLPLIPGYLSFVSGKSAAELRDGSARGLVFLRSAFFVLGFSAVFVSLGLIFSGGGMLLAGKASRWINLGAGLIITLFGLNMIFDFIKILNREARAHVQSKPAGALGSFVVGMAFGAGWTPCIGPILASILFMAARSGRAAEAAALLAAYSLGLGLPFLAAGLFFERLSPLMNWLKKRGRELRIGSGVLLVALGLAMALGRLTTLNGAFSRAGIALMGFSASDPYGARIAAALAWAALAAIALALPLIRKRPLLRWWRLGLVGLFTGLAALEAFGAIGTVAFLGRWLLFQGA